MLWDQSHMMILSGAHDIGSGPVRGRISQNKKKTHFSCKKDGYAKNPAFLQKLNSPPSSKTKTEIEFPHVHTGVWSQWMRFKSLAIHSNSTGGTVLNHGQFSVRPMKVILTMNTYSLFWNSTRILASQFGRRKPISCLKTNLETAFMFLVPK